MLETFKLALMLTTAIIMIADVHCDESKFIKCPLVWSKLSTNEGIPPSSIPTGTAGTEKNDYIIRAQQSNGKYTVGRYYNGKAYVIESNLIKSYNSFDILTNPHGCEVAWQRFFLKPPSHAVPSGTGQTTYVGRGLVPIIQSIIIHKFVQLSGEITGLSIQIVRDESNILPLSSFDVLRSYSKGLTLKVTNFQFDRDIFAAKKDMMGFDLIYNKADTSVKQIVSHKKTVLDRTILTTINTNTHTFQAGFYIQPQFELPLDQIGLGPPIEMSYTFDNPNQKITNITKETEVVVEVTREVRVPGHTSVQICSTVSVLDNFIVNYIARGTYSAPGLTAAEVLLILSKDNGTPVHSVVGNSIIVNEYGSFGGSLALSTQFIVASADDPNGCAEISRQIQDAKKQKF